MNTNIEINMTLKEYQEIELEINVDFTKCLEQKDTLRIQQLN
jgi:hypothetical protein